MRRRFKQSGLLLVGVGVLAAVIAPVVIAASSVTHDNISPASTTVKAALKTGTKTTFTATINAGTTTLIQHCTGSSTSAKTPATGLGPVTTSDPTFTGCTDNLGGKDTVKTAPTWKLTFVDNPKETATSPEVTGAKSGDKLKITIPIKGAIVTSSIDPGCTITAAPTKAASVSGAYDDINTLTITSAPVPIALSGTNCPGGPQTATAKFTATYVLTPHMHDT